MRTRIADYQIIRPLGDDSGDGPSALTASSAAPSTGSSPNPAGGEDVYLAQPPPRLGLGEAPVVVYSSSASAAGRQNQERWLASLAGVRSPYLPVLLELGPDPDFGGVEIGGGGEPGGAVGGSDAAAGVYWSHTWGGDATLAAPPFALSLAYVLWLVAGAARGAHALHEAGMVHGDISGRSVRFNERAASLDLPPRPSNVGQGSIRRITRVSDLDTLDPAVARGELPSRASDIWALGAILQQGLTGQLLHPGLGADPPVTAVQRVMFQPPSLAGGVDPDAARIVGACLAPDPAQRPATAETLAEQLEDLGRRQ